MQRGNGQAQAKNPFKHFQIQLFVLHTLIYYLKIKGLTIAPELKAVFIILIIQAGLF